MFPIYFSALLILILFYLKHSDALWCRKCENVFTLDDCTCSVECAAGEKCYMDEGVTENLTIVYNGGCRATDECQHGYPIGNKRNVDHRQRDQPLFACSRCCDVPFPLGSECNTKLCGIKSMAQRANSSQCYFCDSTKPDGQGDVENPRMCGTLIKCQTDELCGSEMFISGGKITQRFMCKEKKVCLLHTLRALDEMRRCKDPLHYASASCNNRRSARHRVCTTCCGDPLCNNDTCFEVLERLYKLWENNQLDLNTLQTRSSSLYVPIGPSVC